MHLLSLSLKGFRGIRDGLGLDALTLDFESLCDGAELVAIVGANGRGKSTVLDNMHPYLSMPSRSGASGPGGFSYYDHVFLPESEKELVWALRDRCYRSHVVILLNGRRRTEAFLFELSDDGTWRPVQLDDGTVSDGKVETYTRCVEHLCGSADTFFTSVFGAQGKRQLSDYRNAEVKTLLADLLGQETIRELGRRAGETARLLKAGLIAVRQEMAGMDAAGERLSQTAVAAADAPERAIRAEASKSQAAARLDTATQMCARFAAQREHCRGSDARRAQMQAERESVQAAARAAIQELDARECRERDRTDRLNQRIAQRSTQLAKRREGLVEAQSQCQALLARESAAQRAARRLPLAERVLRLRCDRVGEHRRAVEAFAQTQAALRLLSQRVESIEREAGQAALQEQALARRFGLAAEVPCRGSDLQGRCKLLGDAREAQALMPSAGAALQKLAREKADAESQIRTVRTRSERLAGAEFRLVQAERRAERSRTRASRLALWAAKADEMQAARQRLVEVQSELASLDPGPDGSETVEQRAEREERGAIVAALHAIEAQRTRQACEVRQSLERMDALLAALPPPFDARSLAKAEQERDRAAAAHAAAERVHIEALKQVQALDATHLAQAALSKRRASASRRTERIANAVGDWTLFARCMSNDGLIALAIDDAGPALSALANDLLLACYGPRFTVSILTQTETAKGEKREDFDIVVHDAESDESKSVRMMSGGERVWINECLVRAVALYLAQSSDRCYETLFSDEADGALDHERKRMFGAMKREVMRLGGYRREFFISQTAELAGMADVVIDLERYAARQPAIEEP